MRGYGRYLAIATLGAVGVGASLFAAPAYAVLGALVGAVAADRFVGDAISDLEAAVRRIIDDFTSRFGATVDKQTQLVFQQLGALVQSARLSYSDVWSQTIADIGEQRAALINDIAGILLDVQHDMDRGISDLSLSEERFSATLEAVSRAPMIPVILQVNPLQYRIDRSASLPLRIEGKHLDHPGNRIIAGMREFGPSDKRTNWAEFLLPPDALSSDSDGYTRLVLRVHQQDSSWFSWLPWHSPPPPVEFPILLRPLGKQVGSYRLETTYRTGATYLSMREVVEWPSVSPFLRVLGFPEKEEHCVKPPKDAEFDPASTKLTILKNTVYRPAFIKPVKSWGATFPIPVPASETPGPPDAVEIRHNTPEIICAVARDFSQGNVDHDFEGKPVYLIRRLKTEIFYRVHKREPDTAVFVDTGDIPWGQDTTTSQLPTKHEGFRLRVAFQGGDTRVFTRSSRYGPLEVRFDADARVIVLRPIEP